MDNDKHSLTNIDQIMKEKLFNVRIKNSSVDDTLYLHPSIHHYETDDDLQSLDSYSNFEHQNQSNRIQRWENESFLFNILDNNINDEGQSITGINGQFVYSQLLIHYLLHTPLKNKKECIDVFKKDYPHLLQKIDEFEKNYTRENALQWYTEPSFLSILLNRALRKENIDFLFLFRFFIRDLEYELDENRCQSRIELYRGQLIPDMQLEILKNSVGKLISVNSFFSTTRERSTAIFFLGDTNVVDDKKRILFIIDADPDADDIKPFADISRISQFPDEQEVLMMLGSVFRVMKVNRDDDGQIWLVYMTLSDSCKHDLMPIIDSTREEVDDGIETDILSFGQILTCMGKFDYAEKYYYHALNELSDDPEGLADCCYELGVVEWKKNCYDDSHQYHQYALKLRKKLYKSNHPLIADSYNAIGAVFGSKDNIEDALECYKTALSIFQKSPVSFHDRIAGCHNNIACIYEKQKKYVKALFRHYKALRIRRKHLPHPNIHSEVGDSYHNIGNIYKKWHRYSLALRYYKKSLKICRKSLSSNHPDTAIRLGNIGRIYMAKKRFRQALAYLQQAQTIYLHDHINNHVPLTNIEQAIQDIQTKTNCD